MEQPELQMAVDSTSIENGAPQQPEVDSVPVEELERELPLVTDGQIELSDVLSRVVQAIYAELTEMAETYVRVDSGLFILH
jgi:mediator of RNA polymerase II transcription subunit 14